MSDVRRTGPRLAPALLLRAEVAALLITLMLGLGAAPASAQDEINPTAQSVNEEALLDALASDQPLSGRVSIPNENAADLIKMSGRNWTATHNRTLLRITVGASALMLALLAIFYFSKGRIRIENGFSGRTILRFNGLERFAHWLTAASFLLLGLTGLNIVLGRYVLLPLIGEGAFASVSQFGKYAHNYVAWPFMLGLALIVLLWIRDNIPSWGDLHWVRQGGGFLGHGEKPPARRFNAGQKMIFWAVVLGGIVLSYTGIMLLFPELTSDPNAWQQTQVVHSAAAAIMIAISLAHIYLGSLGMEGSFSAMGSGQVDLNWAREHHSLWVQEKMGSEDTETGDGRRGSAAPAE